MPSLPSIGTEWLYLNDLHPFDSTSGDAADPSGLPVEFAFVPKAGYTDDPPVTPKRQKPNDGDWLPGVWVSTTRAKISVGAGGAVSEPGTYKVWCRVTGGEEQPAHDVGVLQIT